MGKTRRDNLKIVSVRPDELDLLCEIAKTTFIETFAHQNEPESFQSYLTENFTRDAVSNEFQNRDSLFYFAKLSEEIVGYLKLNMGEAQTEQKLSQALEIERIYAKSSVQGKGVGKALMQKALEVTTASKLNWIWLGVWEKNLRAIEFYERQGFEVFGTHDFMMGRDKQRDLMMKRAVP